METLLPHTTSLTERLDFGMKDSELGLYMKYFLPEIEQLQPVTRYATLDSSASPTCKCSELTEAKLKQTRNFLVAGA